MRVEQGEAVFSDCRTYRYSLTRVWDETAPRLLFIGLNPSTADETKLDPTLRRVVSFAQREGCGSFDMGNLFAYRATKPRHMREAADPIGPDNDRWLLTMADRASVIIVGWGAHGGFMGRDAAVRELLKGHGLGCLGVTKDGHPRHPLYLPKTAPLTIYPRTPVDA
jgi:hypothetical protein